jgi:hypothetical protein
MNSVKKNILIILFFLVLLTEGVGAAVRLVAQVDNSQDIYVGESFSYNIIIDGENKAGQVDIAPLAEYNPQSAGNRDVSQTSISIINGRTTQNVKKQYVMSYSLVSSRVGPIQLPPVTVTLDGKNYQTNPVEVNILKPGSTDQLELEVTLSEQRCYVGQPVVMTVKFYRYADIGDYRFDVPVLDSGAFYVEEPDDEAGQAKQYRVTKAGRDAVLFTFSKILIPRYAGETEIKPASISAELAVGRARNRDRFFDDRFFDGFFRSRTEYKRFMVSSEPLELTVLPLPDEGKPAGFYGLVGEYTISASAEPTKVNVGDPITLTIKIGGRFLKPVRWPGLEEIPELADNFKIPAEKAAPIIEDGYKIFTQTIRANNDKVSQIPSIPLAYFDAGKGKYEIAGTGPIKLDVSPTKILTNADLEGLDFAPVNKEVEAIKKGLSANYEGPQVLTNQAFSSPAAIVSAPYLFIWAGPLTLLIIGAAAKFLTYTTAEKTAAKRRRAASVKAIRRLKQIAACDDAQNYQMLAATMKQYIGERFDKIAGSLTSDDCFDIVLAQTKCKQSAEKYRDTIAGCEAARYASEEKNIDGSTIKRAAELIKTIEKKARK